MLKNALAEREGFINYYKTICMRHIYFIKTKVTHNVTHICVGYLLN